MQLIKRIKVIFIISIIFSLFIGHIFSKNISYNSETISIEFDNDIFFNKDHKVSNVFAFQKHSSISSNWEEIETFPDFLKDFYTILPKLKKSKQNFYRFTISINQTMQTPKDLSTTELIVNDVPYAGALAINLSFYSFNNVYFKGYGITTGVVGPLSFAKQTQKIIHQIIGDVNPKGWRNQISTEPLLNFNFLIKKKLINFENQNLLSFDASITGDFSIGNLLTHFGTSLELRCGYNLPKGFIYTPDPITFGMQYNASLNPSNPKIYSFYLTITLQGSLIENNIFLDGNTFQNSHHVEKIHTLGKVLGGLHFEHKNWGIHFNLLVTTNNVKTNNFPLANGGEKLGSIIFEWRF